MDTMLLHPQTRQHVLSTNEVARVTAGTREQRKCRERASLPGRRPVRRPHPGPADGPDEVPHGQGLPDRALPSVLAFLGLPLRLRHGHVWGPSLPPGAMAPIWVRLMFYEGEIQVLHFWLFPAGPVGVQAVGSSPAGHTNLGAG